MSKFATQEAIDIAGIKEGIVILRDGSYKIVMSSSSINFALKSEQEQNSLVFQFQSFLNSLHFPIEIVMRSKRLDLTPYLKKVSELAAKQENELLKIQTEDYVDFIGKLINLANIMKKNFYVTVTFNPISVQRKGLIGKLFNKEKTVTELKIGESEFKRNSEELKQRANIVASGLGSMGLHCSQLTTEELIELFYQIYNPEIASKERLGDATNLASTVVEHVSEKKADDEHAAEAHKEEVIDNSQAVTEQQQAQARLKQQEMYTTGQRQIGMNNSQAQTAAKPEAEVKKTEEVGKPIEPAKPQDQSSTPTSSASGQPASTQDSTLAGGYQNLAHVVQNPAPSSQVKS